MLGDEFLSKLAALFDYNAKVAMRNDGMPVPVIVATECLSESAYEHKRYT